MVPKKSGNILSLHAARAEKSTQAAEKLAIRQQRYVATARANAKAEPPADPTAPVVGVTECPICNDAPCGCEVAEGAAA